MTRANRHFTDGNIWHIVHRCYKREFLLKFKRDRDRWKHWLFEAKKRYGLNVPNYTITSNHFHLLVEDSAHQPIANITQLITGLNGQNRRSDLWTILVLSLIPCRFQHGY
jgi:REP element-mobilizing transposase RayT